MRNYDVLSYHPFRRVVVLILMGLLLLNSGCGKGSPGDGASLLPAQPPSIPAGVAEEKPQMLPAPSSEKLRTLPKPAGETLLPKKASSPTVPQEATSEGSSPPKGKNSQTNSPGKAPLPPQPSSSVTRLSFRELYARGSFRGLEFSEKLKSLANQPVEMIGYMAPPLKPTITFFVLTREPMSICPFCSTDADWPEDIVLVLLPPGRKVTPTEKPVRVRGRLETGSRKDEETGFVSLIRIYAQEVKTLYP
ncbi:MAG: hypothetical protein M1299_09300 [Firmicutes bacterium]|nr:hypothetical protein [Bacillota bacterium]MCL5040002.1 hypothetical protein [Bacillota bacterium]